MHMFTRSFVYYSPAANLLYRQTPLPLENAPCHSALYPRTECKLGPCRSVCAVLTTGWCKGERRRPQCTCNLTVVGKREAVETLKQLLYYTLTTQPTIEPTGGPLLATHGIISHIRWTFASEGSLLCAPNLFN